MPLTRQQKEEKVATISSDLSEADACIFMAYDGLSVADMEELRDRLFTEHVRLRVIPKRLLNLALQQVKLDFDPTTVDGQVAVAWGDDAIATAKVLHEFAKSHKENVALVAGAMDEDLLSGEQVMALAQLPSQHELRGQLVSVLAGPIRGFAGVLSGVPRDFVYALNAIREQKS